VVNNIDVRGAASSDIFTPPPSGGKDLLPVRK